STNSHSSDSEDAERHIYSDEGNESDDDERDPELEQLDRLFLAPADLTLFGDPSGTPNFGSAGSTPLDSPPGSAPLSLSSGLPAHPPLQHSACLLPSPQLLVKPLVHFLTFLT